MLRVVMSCICLVSLLGGDHSLYGEETARVRCTLKQLACGEISEPYAKQGVCWVDFEKTVGTPVPTPKVELFAFVGYRVANEIMFIGGVKAEAGLLIRCEVPTSLKGQGPQLDALKKDLAALVISDEEIKKKFPNLKQVKLEEKFSFKEMDEKTLKSLQEQSNYNSLFKQAK